MREAIRSLPADVIYSSQGNEILFNAYTRSFGVLGGVPRRGGQQRTSPRADQ